MKESDLSAIEYLIAIKIPDTHSFVLAHGCRDNVSSVPSVGMVSTVIPFSAHLSTASYQEAAGCRTVMTGALARITGEVSVVIGTSGRAVVSAVVGKSAVVVVAGGGWTGGVQGVVEYPGVVVAGGDQGGSG